ncbi:hypothetical protein Aperf_G00000059882 [Anoplocephala perfoliata]
MPSVIISGPSGCGKTTIASYIHHYINCIFIEGDELHSAENIAKMSSGIPLTDEDRQPWLESIRNAIVKARDSRQSTLVVATCSALKRQYRRILSQPPNSDVLFVFLDAPRDLLLARVSQRVNHFLPASLVQSQLDTLEAPNCDEENVLVVDASLPPNMILTKVLTHLGLNKMNTIS